MSDDRKPDGLDQALRRLAREDETMSASPGVERRLLAEVRAMNGASRGTSRGLTLALAASLLATVGASAMWLRTIPSTVAPVGNVAASVTTPFFPLFYASVPAASVQ